jgi:hypothetical protein
VSEPIRPLDLPVSVRVRKLSTTYCGMVGEWPGLVVMHPGVWDQIVADAEATATFESAETGTQVWGLPVEKDASLPEGAFYVRPAKVTG